MMKLLLFDKEKLITYFDLVYSATEERLISDEGNFDENKIQFVKEQLLGYQKIFFKTAALEKIKTIAPIELHPYIAPLSFNRKFLLLGTFPPPSYLIQQYDWSNNSKLKAVKIGKLPIVDFFYGNMASLWDILDIDMGANDRSQKLSNLISQLETKNIECSDIILGCQRESLEEGRSDDSKLYNIIPNFKLVNEVLEDKNIERIIFTSANWDLQKRGTIKNMNSTLGLFLQIITSMFEVNVDVENKWVSLSNLRVNRNAFYIKYYKKTRKGQQSGQPTINYKAPNFLKIQIKNNDHFRIITLIGLPSPSKRAQKNVENTTYFGLWKIYQEQMGRNSEKKYFLKHLYKLAFSEDIADLNELFKIQDIGVKIT